MLFRSAPFTSAGTAADASQTFTLAAVNSAVVVGYIIEGTGIATDTKVTAIDASDARILTLSKATTAAITAGTVTFKHAYARRRRQLAAGEAWIEEGSSGSAGSGRRLLDHDDLGHRGGPASASGQYGQGPYKADAGMGVGQYGVEQFAYSIRMLPDSNESVAEGFVNVTTRTSEYDNQFKAVLMAYNVSLRLGSTDMHNVGDTWAVAAIVCNGNAKSPPGTKARVTVDREGNADVKALALATPFAGTQTGPEEVYLVNQHFTVRAPATAVQRVLVKDTTNGVWTNGEPEFTLGVPGGGGAGTLNKTVCLKWNAFDYEVQRTIEKNLGLSVTVTRGVDNADAPNGYVYSIYFDGDDATDNRKIGALTDRKSVV